MQGSYRRIVRQRVFSFTAKLSKMFLKRRKLGQQKQRFLRICVSVQTDIRRGVHTNKRAVTYANTRAFARARAHTHTHASACVHARTSRDPDRKQSGLVSPTPNLRPHHRHRTVPLSPLTNPTFHPSPPLPRRKCLSLNKHLVQHKCCVCVWGGGGGRGGRGELCLCLRKREGGGGGGGGLCLRAYGHEFPWIVLLLSVSKMTRQKCCTFRYKTITTGIFCLISTGPVPLSVGQRCPGAFHHSV